MSFLVKNIECIFLIHSIPFEAVFLGMIFLFVLVRILVPLRQNENSNGSKRGQVCAAIVFGKAINLLVSVIAWLESKFRSLSQQKNLSIFAILAFSFGGAAAVSLFVRQPEPFVHDEFSYLLAADTFSRGRLANPPHPMWQHFETFHVLQKPTYASKYPPAQGLVLAAGEVISGRPILGVWLSYGFCCASICWMLQAWFSSEWAFLGALIAALRLGFIGRWAYWLPGQGLGYWSQSYWGGSVAAMGGALVFGSLRRLWDRPRARYGWILGLGVGMLANSRPFEGAVIIIPVTAALGYWFFRTDRIVRKEKSRVMVSIFITLVLTFSIMGYYNWRVTGDPLRFPYQEYESEYASTPTFPNFQQTSDHAYRHEVMRRYYLEWARMSQMRLYSFEGLWPALQNHLRVLLGFHFGLLSLFPLLFLPWAVRDKWIRFVLAVVLLFILGITPIQGGYPHYYAPISALLFILMLAGLQRMWDVSYKGRRLGRLAVKSLALATIALVGVSLANWATDDFFSSPINLFRRKLITSLQAQDGAHLLVVRYKPEHNPNEEWVYNEADIDNSKVVWAREMGGEEDKKLLEYFKNRRVWLLEPDQWPPKLSEYKVKG